MCVVMHLPGAPKDPTSGCYEHSCKSNFSLRLLPVCCAPCCWLQAPWLQQQRWGASDVGRVQAKSSIHSTRQRTAVRMVAEVPALDERVKAVMEAEAAMEAQSAQGIVLFLVSRNTTPHAVYERGRINV